MSSSADSATPNSRCPRSSWLVDRPLRQSSPRCSPRAARQPLSWAFAIRDRCVRELCVVPRGTVRWSVGEAKRPTLIRRLHMPIVTVQQGPRDVELKRDLVARITDAFVDALKVPADSVQVWIQEVPTDSWAIGGTLA